LPLLQDILETLSVPYARRQVAPLFVDLFRSPPDAEDPLRPADSHPIGDDVRYGLGAGLAVFTSPSLADPLIEFALAREYGWTRSQIVVSLPKTKEPRVPVALLSLMTDRSVAAYAIESIGKDEMGPSREADRRVPR